MQTSWGILTIGAQPVSIPNVQYCCKLSFQLAPGAQGLVKIGAVGLTTDNTTPGTVLNPTTGLNPDASTPAGASWSVESHQDANTIYPSQYLIYGTHAGDVVFYETHVS